MKLPVEWLNFIKENDLNPQEYIAIDDIPRYIRLESRLKPDSNCDFHDLVKAFGPSIERVDWLHDFYKIDSKCNLSNNHLYKKGLVYGMDISSGVAVHALDIEPEDHVLDLCCAPGNKMCYIADKQGKDGLGTVTGVDIVKHRLHTTRNLCQKYGLSKYRLFLMDGTRFPVLSVSRIGKHARYTLDDLCANPPKTKIKPFHASRLIRDDPQIGHDILLYDKVLVDSECTHDASIFRMKKQLDSEHFGKIFDQSKLAKLEDLQRGLIKNGFRLLKPGGILVYSTCSFSRKQNEDIVSWFLKNHSDASLEPIPNASSFPLASQIGPSQVFEDVQGLEYAIRLSPMASQTSGLFIARIRKKI